MTNNERDHGGDAPYATSVNFSMFPTCSMQTHAHNQYTICQPEPKSACKLRSIFLFYILSSPQ
jgi:hypothetical protein